MLEDISAVKRDAETRMKKSIEALKNELTKLRTGRASASILDHVTVDYYGSQMPISQVANISVTDARTLQVTPWERSMLNKIDKAIRESDLGLNPSSSSDSLRVPLPPLSEERRREMTKLVRHEGEGARVAIRNVRRDANNNLKDLQKKKLISEDEERRVQEEIQTLTNRYIDEVDAVVGAKESDLMEV